MKTTLIVLSAISLLLLTQDETSVQSLRKRLQSSGVQVRCDAFYELFGTGEGGENPIIQIHGKTTNEIHELLGKPTSTAVLEYEGTKWLRVTYLFEKCPTHVSDSVQKSCDEGWRFSPSLMFRNGISVRYQVFADETRASRYSVTPEHLRFQKGGTFP